MFAGGEAPNHPILLLLLTCEQHHACVTRREGASGVFAPVTGSSYISSTVVHPRTDYQSTRRGFHPSPARAEFPGLLPSARVSRRPVERPAAVRSAIPPP